MLSASSFAGGLWETTGQEYQEMKWQEKHIQGSIHIEEIFGLVVAEAIRMSSRMSPILNRLDWKIWISDHGMNALAYANGLIEIKRGLIFFKEHELAYVIGHEVAHILENHIGERQVVEHLQMKLRTNKWKDHLEKKETIERLKEILFESDPERQFFKENSDWSDPRIADIFYTIGEIEADKIGMQISKRAGYNPEAYYSALEKRLAYEKEMGINSNDSAHLKIEDRLKMIRDVIPEIKKLKVSKNRTPHPVKLIMTPLSEIMKKYERIKKESDE